MGDVCVPEGRRPHHDQLQLLHHGRLPVDPDQAPGIIFSLLVSLSLSPSLFPSCLPPSLLCPSSLSLFLPSTSPPPLVLKLQLPSSRARPERLSSARPLSIFPRNNSTTHALCRQPSSSALTRACAAHEQAARTASLVLEADGFKKLIDYEQLEPVRQGGVIPWCMKQVPLRPFLFLFLSPRHLALALAPLAFVFPSSA